MKISFKFSQYFKSYSFIFVNFTHIPGILIEIINHIFIYLLI